MVHGTTVVVPKFDVLPHKAFRRCLTFQFTNADCATDSMILRSKCDCTSKYDSIMVPPSSGAPRMTWLVNGSFILEGLMLSHSQGLIARMTVC